MAFSHARVILCMMPAWIQGSETKATQNVHIKTTHLPEYSNTVFMSVKRFNFEKTDGCVATTPKAVKRLNSPLLSATTLQQC